MIGQLNALIGNYPEAVSEEFEGKFHFSEYAPIHACKLSCVNKRVIEINKNRDLAVL
jgi:hypothetical protein